MGPICGLIASHTVPAEGRLVAHERHVFILFAIPAISMRATADERRTRTLELLVTQPVRDWEIVLGKWLAYFGTNLSPALLGVGYIVGLNIGALALIGGMISWSVAIPVYAAWFLQDNAPLAQQLAGADAETMANAIWSAQVRYLGVGAMLVGGMWALVSIRSSLASGIRSGLEATRAGALHGELRRRVLLDTHSHRA